MGNCGNCKYWGDKFKVVKDIADCGKIDTIDATANKDTYFDIEASASDDTGLTANLMTGKNFGCIHFKQK